jgi:hypothetical protein
MRASFLIFPVLLLVACSSAGLAAGPTPEGDADAAPPEGGEMSDAGGDAQRAPTDSGTVKADAAPPPPAGDPLCDTVTGTVTFGATIPRSAAEPMPFGYRTLLNGQRPSGNVVDDRQQWFSFTVDAPRDLAIAFDGSSKTSANFYFASETTPAARLGGPTVKSTLHVDAGTYYVQIVDGPFLNQGGSWDVSMRWVVPPAACADAGL